MSSHFSAISTICFYYHFLAKLTYSPSALCFVFELGTKREIQVRFFESSNFSQTLNIRFGVYREKSGYYEVKSQRNTTFDAIFPALSADGPKGLDLFEIRLGPNSHNEETDFGIKIWIQDGVNTHGYKVDEKLWEDHQDWYKPLKTGIYSEKVCINYSFIDITRSEIPEKGFNETAGRKSSIKQKYWQYLLIQHQILYT